MGFRGGYVFKHFEGAAQPVLRDIPVPRKIVLPRREHPLNALVPVVREGDSVRAGEKILESNTSTKTAHVSPVNGSIKRIDNESIAIASDGTESFKPVEGHIREPWHLERSEVFDIFCSTGCSLLWNGRFSSLKQCETITHVIVNAVHNSPLNQSWTPDIIGNSTVLLKGLKTLAALFPEAETVIAINKRNHDYFEDSELKKHLNIKVMSDRYPQEHPELLARDTANRRLVSHDGEIDESILVIEFSDVIQIAEVMTQGRPLIDRVLTIAGPGVSNPGWYRVRIGTSYEDIKHHLFKSDEYGPWRTILGNPLCGEGLCSFDGSILFSDTEISVISEHEVRELFSFLRPGFDADSYTKTTVSEYVHILPKKLETGVHSGVRPCVQCNYCDEVCPVNIYPFLIWKYMETDSVEETFRLQPYNCIECGLCNYVCPSKIDILPSVKEAKEAYRRLRRTDAISD